MNNIVMGIIFAVVGICGVIRLVFDIQELKKYQRK
jgi:uncharacterized membrane protein YuzA (DUF378 family)